MNKSDNSNPDSDKDENQQTVTRIFHGLYIVTRERDNGLSKLFGRFPDFIVEEYATTCIPTM